jgi:hypothetical protein
MPIKSACHLVAVAVSLHAIAAGAARSIDGEACEKQAKLGDALCLGILSYSFDPGRKKCRYQGPIFAELKFDRSALDRTPVRCRNRKRRNVSDAVNRKDDRAQAREPGQSPYSPQICFEVASTAQSRCPSSKSARPSQGLRSEGTGDPWKFAGHGRNTEYRKFEEQALFPPNRRSVRERMPHHLLRCY